MPSKRERGKTGPSSQIPGSRAEVLRLLDQIPTTTAASVQAAHTIRSLIERSWDDDALPKRRVRIWWTPTDVVVRANSPSEAMNLAMIIAAATSPMRAAIFAEDKDGAWAMEAEHAL